MRWAGHVERMGRGEACTGFWWKKPERKTPLGRPSCRWEENVTMDIQEVRCGGIDWIKLAQDTERWQALVNAAMNLRIPQNAGNYLTSCKPVSFSSMEYVSKYIGNTTICIFVLRAYWHYIQYHFRVLKL